MVKPCIVAICLLFMHCSRDFVMKPKDFTRPVMVGEVRQLGGEKKPPEADKGYEFSAEIDILDTTTTSTLELDKKSEKILDHKLIATSLNGARDPIIGEIRFGSYVLFPILFYFDKDWIQVSGYGQDTLYREPERVYNLNPPMRFSPKDRREEKMQREKEKKKREKEKREAKRKKKRR